MGSHIGCVQGCGGGGKDGLASHIGCVHGGWGGGGEDGLGSHIGCVHGGDGNGGDIGNGGFGSHIGCVQGARGGGKGGGDGGLVQVSCSHLLKLLYTVILGLNALHSQGHSISVTQTCKHSSTEKYKLLSVDFLLHNLISSHLHVVKCEKFEHADVLFKVYVDSHSSHCHILLHDLPLENDIRKIIIWYNSLRMLCLNMEKKTAISNIS